MLPLALADALLLGPHPLPHWSHNEVCAIGRLSVSRASFVTLAAFGAYIGWTHVVRAVSGHWPYAFLHRAKGAHARLALHLASLALILAAAHVSARLLGIEGNGVLRLTPRRAPAPSTQTTEL